MSASNAGFFKLEDKYKLQVSQMGNSHQRLILLMNDLYEMNQNKLDFSVLVLKVDELYKFTVLHFQQEEKYFTTLAYGKAEIHRNIHKNLLSKMRVHVETIKKEKRLTNEFFDFLKVWLSSHIVGIDQGFVAVGRST